MNHLKFCEHCGANLPASGTEPAICRECSGLTRAPGLNETCQNCAHCNSLVRLATAYCAYCGGSRAAAPVRTIEPTSQFALAEIANMLQLIAHRPGLRSMPRGDDVDGEFDAWFDGGAIRYLTGYNEFHFPDGTRATQFVVPRIHVEIVHAERGRISVTAGQ